MFTIRALGDGNEQQKRDWNAGGTQEDVGESSRTRIEREHQAA